MFRTLIIATCFAFTAQNAFAAFDRCVNDIQALSQQLNQAATDIDSIFVNDGHARFSYFSKLMKTGQTRHYSNAKRYFQRKNINFVPQYGQQVLASISTSLQSAHPAARKCKQSNSCSGLDRSKKYMKDLQIKCDQANKVVAALEAFRANPSEKALKAANSKIRAMRGTDRNAFIIARSQKVHNSGVTTNQVAQGGEVTNSGNGELTSTTPATNHNVLPQEKRAKSRKRNRRSTYGDSVGSIEAVERCQRRFSRSSKRNMRRWAMCGCRIHANKRTRWNCQGNRHTKRGIAYQSNSEICGSRMRIPAFRRLFGRICRRY